MEIIKSPKIDNCLDSNLKRLLDYHNISERELANAVNLPQMTIHRLCNGTTTDPRSSTLQCIADYFDISIDDLLNGDIEPNFLKGTITRFIPIIDWKDLEDLQKSPLKDLSQQWQPIVTDHDFTLSESSFALMSRPSMHDVYPPSTLFIIDPDTQAVDGDIVLAKLENNSSFMLKKLFIDPPHRILQSLINTTHKLELDEINDSIHGTVALTLIRNRT